MDILFNRKITKVISIFLSGLLLWQGVVWADPGVGVRNTNYILQPQTGFAAFDRENTFLAVTARYLAYYVAEFESRENGYAHNVIAAKSYYESAIQKLRDSKKVPEDYKKLLPKILENTTQNGYIAIDIGEIRIVYYDNEWFGAKDPDPGYQRTVQKNVKISDHLYRQVLLKKPIASTAANNRRSQLTLDFKNKFNPLIAQKDTSQTLEKIEEKAREVIEKYPFLTPQYMVRVLVEVLPEDVEAMSGVITEEDIAKKIGWVCIPDDEVRTHYESGKEIIVMYQMFQHGRQVFYVDENDKWWGLKGVQLTNSFRSLLAIHMEENSKITYRELGHDQSGLSSLASIRLNRKIISELMEKSEMKLKLTQVVVGAELKELYNGMTGKFDEVNNFLIRDWLTPSRSEAEQVAPAVSLIYYGDFRELFRFSEISSFESLFESYKSFSSTARSYEMLIELEKIRKLLGLNPEDKDETIKTVLGQAASQLAELINCGYVHRALQNTHNVNLNGNLVDYDTVIKVSEIKDHSIADSEDWISYVNTDYSSLLNHTKNDSNKDIMREMYFDTINEDVEENINDYISDKIFEIINDDESRDEIIKIDRSNFQLVKVVYDYLGTERGKAYFNSLIKEHNNNVIEDLDDDRHRKIGDVGGNKISPQPGTILALKEKIAPEMSLDEYSVGKGPRWETGIFTAIPFLILSTLMFMGVLGIGGFVLWTSATQAIFVGLHVGNLSRGSPADGEEKTKLLDVLKASIEIAINNLIVSVPIGLTKYFFPKISLSFEIALMVSILSTGLICFSVVLFHQMINKKPSKSLIIDFAQRFNPLIAKKNAVQTLEKIEAKARKVIEKYPFLTPQYMGRVLVEVLPEDVEAMSGVISKKDIAQKIGWVCVPKEDVEALYSRGKEIAIMYQMFKTHGRQVFYVDDNDKWWGLKGVQLTDSYKKWFAEEKGMNLKTTYRKLGENNSGLSSLTAVKLNRKVIPEIEDKSQGRVKLSQFIVGAELKKLYNGITERFDNVDKRSWLSAERPELEQVTPAISVTYYGDLRKTLRFCGMGYLYEMTVKTPLEKIRDKLKEIIFSLGLDHYKETIQNLVKQEASQLAELINSGFGHGSVVLHNVNLEGNLLDYDTMRDISKKLPDDENTVNRIEKIADWLSCVEVDYEGLREQITGELLVKGRYAIYLVNIIRESFFEKLSDKNKNYIDEIVKALIDTKIAEALENDEIVINKKELFQDLTVVNDYLKKTERGKAYFNSLMEEYKDNNVLEDPGGGKYRKLEVFPIRSERENILDNAEKVMPKMKLAMAEAAAKASDAGVDDSDKFVIGIDLDIGKGEINKAIEMVAERLPGIISDSGDFAKTLKNLTIVPERGKELAARIRNITGDKGKVKAENIIVLTKETHMSLFDSVKDRATIAGINDRDFPETAYLPLLEIMLYAIAKHAGWEDSLDEYYNMIPNVDSLDDAGGKDFIINLIPNAVPFAEGEIPQIMNEVLTVLKQA